MSTPRNEEDVRNDRMLQRMSSQINEMHTTLFGAQSQGGLLRKVEQIEVKVNEMHTVYLKMCGACAVISALIGLVFKYGLHSN